MASVNSEISSSHKTASIRQKEHDGTAELVGIADPIEHVLLGPPLVHARLGQGISGSRSPDITGRDRVHADQRHSFARAPFRG